MDAIEKKKFMNTFRKTNLVVLEDYIVCSKDLKKTLEEILNEEQRKENEIYKTVVILIELAGKVLKEKLRYGHTL